VPWPRRFAPRGADFLAHHTATVRLLYGATMWHGRLRSLLLDATERAARFARASAQRPAQISPEGATTWDDAKLRTTARRAPEAHPGGWSASATPVRLELGWARHDQGQARKKRSGQDDEHDDQGRHVCLATRARAGLTASIPAPRGHGGRRPRPATRTLEVIRTHEHRWDSRGCAAPTPFGALRALPFPSQRRPVRQRRVALGARRAHTSRGTCR
jgi:hypothetical protein